MKRKVNRNNTEDKAVGVLCLPRRSGPHTQLVSLESVSNHHGNIQPNKGMHCFSNQSRDTNWVIYCNRNKQAQLNMKLSNGAIYSFSLLALVSNTAPIVAFQSTPRRVSATTVAFPQRQSSVSTTCLSAKIDLSPEAPRDVHTMSDWATGYGAQACEGFDFTSDDGVDISVGTTTDLPLDTLVLYVPKDLILSATQIREELGVFAKMEERLISARSRDHIPYFYLFVKILMEYQMGDESPWYPWLNSMPRRFNNGASMTPFCFDCLPPLAGYLASLERIKLGQFIYLLDSCVSEDIVPLEIKRNNYDLVRWAFNVVYTRACENPNNGEILLIPMGDMLNHGAEPEAAVYFDEEGNYMAYAAKDVPAGSPLTVQYADPTNPSHLLARYGFLDKSSPATFCKIMINNPSQELKDMGYDHSRMLFYHDSGEVAEEVWDVLLYRYLKENDKDTMQALYDAHMNGDVETKQAIHAQYFEYTLNALQKHVDEFLLELDVLQQKGVGKSVEEHPRLPLIQSHNEFVRETFLNVREQLYQYQYA